MNKQQLKVRIQLINDDIERNEKEFNDLVNEKNKLIDQLEKFK